MAFEVTFSYKKDANVSRRNVLAATQRAFVTCAVTLGYVIVTIECYKLLQIVTLYEINVTKRSVDL